MVLGTHPSTVDTSFARALLCTDDGSSVARAGLRLWGGAFGEALAKAILDEGSSVLAFLDAFILESPIDGIPVLRPEAAAVERSIPVLNSVLGHGDLDKHLRDLGFAEVFSTESAFRIAPAALRNLVEDGFMWRASTVDERVDPKAIADLMGILTDVTSRDLLQRLIAFRQEPSYKTYPWPTLGPFYFPQDVPFYNGLDALRVIDCGAFDGDTLRRLSARFGEHLASYLGVEANPDNAALLRQPAALLSEEWTGHPDSYRVEEAACAEFDGLGLHGKWNHWISTSREPSAYFFRPHRSLPSTR